MKMNKIGLLTLSVLALTACGGKGGDGSIVVWAPAEEQEVINAVVESYNKANPNDQIKFTFKAVSEADGGTTVATDPTVKGYPSLFAAADDHLNNLINKNIVNPVPAAYAPDTAKTAQTALTAASSAEGKLYGYPISTDNGYFLYYNKAVLTAEDAGSFEAILAKAAASDKTVVWDVANGYYAASFFLSPDVCGVNSLKWTQSADKKTITYTTDWDNEKGSAMALKTSELFTTYDGATGSKKTLVTGDDKVITTEAGEGRLAATISGTWMQSALSEAWGDNLAAVKLPTLDGKQLGSFAGTKLYLVNGYAYAPEQKTAYKLAQLLTNKESQLIRYEKRNAIPCNLDAQADARYAEHLTPTISALAEQSKYAAVQATAAESKYWDIGKAIGQAILDGKTGDTALSTTAAWAGYLKGQLDVLRG